MGKINRIQKYCATIGAVGLVWGSVVLAEVLTWDPPTEREGGEPLAPYEIKEYRLYDKRKLVRTIPAPTVKTSVIILGGRNYAFEVTAVDKGGAESVYSNAVVIQPTPVPTLEWPPANPGNLRSGQ